MPEACVTPPTLFIQPPPPHSIHLAPKLPGFGAATYQMPWQATTPPTSFPRQHQVGNHVKFPTHPPTLFSLFSLSIYFTVPEWRSTPFPYLKRMYISFTCYSHLVSLNKVKYWAKIYVFFISAHLGTVFGDTGLGMP